MLSATTAAGGGFGAVAETAQGLRVMTKSAGTIGARNARPNYHESRHIRLALDTPRPTRGRLAEIDAQDRLAYP